MEQTVAISRHRDRHEEWHKAVVVVIQQSHWDSTLMMVLQWQGDCSCTKSAVSVHSWSVEAFFQSRL